MIDVNGSKLLCDIRDPKTSRMLEGTVIKVRDGEEDYLYTYGLAGCFAQLLYAKTEGLQYGAILHFPPSQVEWNANKIREIVRQHPDIGTASVKSAVIFHVRYCDTDGLNRIRAAIKDGMGDVDLQEVSYSTAVLGCNRTNYLYLSLGPIPFWESWATPRSYFNQP